MTDNAEFMLALIARYQSGDTSAADELIDYNGGAVARVVRRFQPRADLDHDDMIQEARIVVLNSAISYRLDDARRAPWLPFLCANIGKRLYKLITQFPESHQWESNLDYLCWLQSMEDQNDPEPRPYDLGIGDALEVVQRLPDGPRRAFILRNNLDDRERPGDGTRTNEEVARLLKTLPSVVAGWMAEAKRLLRQRIADLEYERLGSRASVARPLEQEEAA